MTPGLIGHRLPQGQQFTQLARDGAVMGKDVTTGVTTDCDSPRYSLVFVDGFESRWVYWHHHPESSEARQGPFSIGSLNRLDLRLDS